MVNDRAIAEDIIGGEARIRRPGLIRKSPVYLVEEKCDVGPVTQFVHDHPRLAGSIYPMAYILGGAIACGIGAGLAGPAHADDFTVDHRTMVNDGEDEGALVHTDTQFRLRTDSRLDLGLEHFTYPEGTENSTSGFLGVPLDEIGDLPFRADLNLFGGWDSDGGNTSREAKLVVEPENWRLIAGYGEDDSGLRVKYGDVSFIHGCLGSPDNFRVGAQAVDIDSPSHNETDLGAYGWAKVGGVFAGYGHYTDKDVFMLGYPNKGGPALAFFRIEGGDGLEVDRLFVTPHAVALADINLQSVLENEVAYPLDSLTNTSTNPVRFRADLEQRGDGIVLGLGHRRVPEWGHSYDVELVKTIGGDGFWVGAGYTRNDLYVGEDTDTVRLEFGRSTGFYYSIKKGDPFNFRLVGSYNHDTGDVDFYLGLLKRF